MTRLVARILAAKQREAEADTSALERDIDELVYALYGLPRKKKPSCKPPPNEPARGVHAASPYTLRTA